MTLIPMPIYTVIIRLSSGAFSVHETESVETLLDVLRNKTSKGYYHHKNNRGNAKVVFCVEGQFRQNIKSFGVKKFMSVMDSYDPFIDFIGQVM